MTSSWQAKHVGRKGVQRLDSGPFPPQKIHQWQLPQQCFRLTKVTSHGLVSPSSTGKICPFFPQLQRKNSGHPPPPLCWAVFYSQKKDLSMSWAVQNSTVWDGDQRVRNSNKKHRLLCKSHAASSVQSLPLDVTVPPWHNFNLGLPPPHSMLLT